MNTDFDSTTTDLESLKYRFGLEDQYYTYSCDVAYVRVNLTYLTHCQIVQADNSFSMMWQWIHVKVNG